ncbi:MAG: carbohydrate ABC transporter permease [Oscillospiraceae bacterium]|jgi:putative aldouronate transport system permease protein|nr:carbohydrate ABC transporter permease [Oscillospiraceae bacterium]
MTGASPKISAVPGKAGAKRRPSAGSFLIHLFVGAFALACLYPFALVIAGSFTTKAYSTLHGFTLWPGVGGLTLAAYQSLFVNMTFIVNGYKVTLFTTIFGTALSLFTNSMMGFTLSRKQLKGRRAINFYVLFTMLFSGGMVPWYIICIRYLGWMVDTVWALIIPMLAGPWNIFLFRNYFTSVPDALYESARIDGAGDFRIYSGIYIRVSAPVLATVTLFTALGFWNDWWLGLMLIKDHTELYPLQMLLRNIISNLQFLQTMEASPQVQALMASIPSDSVRMALVIVTTGPILLLYPFAQRYFVKGIMVGAVKG